VPCHDNESSDTVGMPLAYGYIHTPLPDIRCLPMIAGVIKILC
jgi:hypothetical protein